MVTPMGLEVTNLPAGPVDLRYSNDPVDLILVDGLHYRQMEDQIEKLRQAEQSVVIVLAEDGKAAGETPATGDGIFQSTLEYLPQAIVLLLPQVDLRREVRCMQNQEYDEVDAEGIFQEQDQQIASLTSQLRLKNAVMEHVRCGVFLVDLHGKITWVNSHFTEMTGLSAETIIGQTPGFIYRNTQNSPLIDRVLRQAFSGKAWHDRVEYLTEDGIQRTHYLAVTPFLDESGELSHFISIAQDCEAAASLADKDGLYRQIVEQSPVMIATIQGRDLVFINEAGAHLLGFGSREELIGRSWRQLFPGESFKNFVLESQQGTGSNSMEAPFPRQDSSEVVLSLTCLRPSSARDGLVHVIGQDITPRKRIEESLHHQASLSSVEQAINQSLELDEILDQINELAIKVLMVDGGAIILLLEGEKDTLVARSLKLDRPGSDGLPAFSPAESHVLRWIMKHKQMLVVPDFEDSSLDTRDLEERFGANSFLGVPILLDEELQGILLILDKKPRPFNPVDIEYVTALANRAALAVAKEKIFQSLQASKTEAEEAAQNRAEYLASMSHELRAPLAAINNLSELMTGTDLSAVQAEYLALIKSSTERLLALMNDILDFSRLEASKLGLVEKQFNLIQLLENTLDLAAIPAAQKGLDLAYRVDEDVPETLLGDANRLAQVLTNLLTNAIKFTESGYIFIEIRLRADKIALLSMVDSEVEIQFSVHDTGIGIPPEQQASLFTPFSQVNLPQRPSQPGSGLGLAICKQLVQLMNGDIWVTSKGIQGKGSTFTFTTRFKVVHTPTAPYFQQDQPYLLGKKIVVIGQDRLSWQLLLRRLEFWGLSLKIFDEPSLAARWLASAPAVDLVILDLNSVHPVDDESLVKSIQVLREVQYLPILAYVHPNTLVRDTWRGSATTILRRPISLPRLYRGLVDTIHFNSTDTRPRSRETELEILLVDDDLINVAAVKMQLERLGYGAETVSNGVEAMQIMAQKKYDLIIMDMRMDAMDGHATTRAIRQTIPPDRQPLIAILTAGVTPNQLNALQSAGIDAYLEKPISIDRLLHLLELAHRNEDARYHPLILGVKPPGVRVVVTAESGLDKKVLQDLLTLAGSQDSQSPIEILDLYFQSAPNVMEQTSLAARAGQPDLLKDNLHALRGACEIFGAVRLAQLCKSLEQELQDGSQIDLDTRMVAIEDEFAVVTQQLQEFRDLNSA